MKTINNKLSTGVTVSFKDKGGLLTVLSPYMTLTYNKTFINGITNIKLI